MAVINNDQHSFSKKCKIYFFLNKSTNFKCPKMHYNEKKTATTMWYSHLEKSNEILFIVEMNRFYNQNAIFDHSNRKKINILKLCHQPFFYVFIRKKNIWCDHCFWSLCEFVSVNPRADEIIRIRLWCHIYKRKKKLWCAVSPFRWSIGFVVACKEELFLGLGKRRWMAR